MHRTRVLRTGCLAALVLIFSARLVPAHAAPLTFGNILVSAETFQLREFTPSGVLVQTFAIPAVPGGDGAPRDIVVDALGNVEIYNGTFLPFLTTLNPTTGTVLKNTTFPGWSTVSNGTFGGIAAFGDFVYVTDMRTAGAGSPDGIIRFNINDFSGMRFDSGTEYTDASMGRDGRLYALGVDLAVFDPVSMSLLKRVTLPFIDLRSIAVDQNGDIFAVAFNDDRIYHFNSNGGLLRTLSTGVRSFWDIDIDGDGRLIASSGASLVLTDRSLSTFNVLNVGTTGPGGLFVAFVQPPLGTAAVVPEPETLTLLGVAAALLCGTVWRRRMR
jgi:hypothetical protein